MITRRLDPETIVSRLRTMRQLLDQLERLRLERLRLERLGLERLGNESGSDDFGRRLQIERILSALVDLAVAINTHVVVVRLGEAPHDMTASFRLAAEAGLLDADLAAELAPSVGLRNVIVHAYVDLDVARMMEAVPLAAGQYSRYVEQVARWLRALPEE
jgi:uncharacterized protein YutE (UPF0331/DUF86 family)